MTTFIVLAVYIVGVWIAYFQIQKWADHKVTKEDELQMLFMLSLLSWFIYPLYIFVFMIKNAKGD